MDIEKLAREAGIEAQGYDDSVFVSSDGIVTCFDELRRFATLVAEEAAKVAEAEAVEECDPTDIAYNVATSHCARAIRERFKA